MLKDDETEKQIYVLADDEGKKVDPVAPNAFTSTGNTNQSQAHQEAEEQLERLRTISGGRV